MDATIVEEALPVERRTHGAEWARAKTPGRREAGMTETERMAQLACGEQPPTMVSTMAQTTAKIRGVGRGHGAP
jgi:hypothetical protein